MSCNEWEAGTIKLPANEFPKLLKSVRAAAKAHNVAVFEATQQFWKALPANAKRDRCLYGLWAEMLCYGGHGEHWPNGQGGTRRTLSRPAGWHPRGLAHADHDTERGIANDVHSLLCHAWHDRDGQGRGWVQRDRARRIIRRDYPVVNGATLTFTVGEPRIWFDRAQRTVTWDVPENNHACDGCRNHPVARSLFTALERVRWTRGSGGDIVGNNEYSAEDRSVGGGGNYLVSRYGPDRQRPTMGVW